MTTWRTIHELRIFVVLDVGPISWVEHFDTLDAASERFAKAVDNVRSSLGLTKTFATPNGNEIAGVVQRGIVEIATGRTDGTTRAELRVLPKYSTILEPDPIDPPGPDEPIEEAS